MVGMDGVPLHPKTGIARGPVEVTDPGAIDVDAMLLARLKTVHGVLLAASPKPVRVRHFPTVRPGVAYALPAERVVVVGTAVYESVARAVEALPEPERSRWILEP